MHAANAPRRRRCRYCGEGLSTLQAMRGDACTRPPCRRAAIEAAVAGRRAVALERRRRAALRAGAPAWVADAGVVWLAPHDTLVVPLPAALRDEQARHLGALVAGAQVAPLPPHEARPDPAPGSAEAGAAGVVCTLCRGRCCRPGQEHHGFVDRALLERWVAAHAGSTLDDAAQAYRACLPRRHVSGSCAYHGPQGCTLPRPMRSHICNGFRCDALRAAQAADTGLLVALPSPAGVRRAAWLHDGRGAALPARPHPA